MFATRNQNENAIYEQQTAAAAKPLNQSVKGLAPKTPSNKQAPKTPFRGGKNDENAQQPLFGKTGGKETAKPNRNAFVTPANPTTRAPLGNKTTNAKALQAPSLKVPAEDGKTPASAKPTSPRLRRSKIKVHESLDTAHDVLNKDPEERDIEYMPPRGVPLNDDPVEVLPHDMNLDVLKGSNLTRGWWSEHAPTKEDNGEDSELSDFEEKIKKAEAEKRKREPQPKKSATRPAIARTVTSGPLTKKPAPTTLRAQNAASALGSRPVTKPSVSRFGASNTALKAKQPGPGFSASVTAKKHTPAPGNPRFTAAKVASNNTIGYSKGRTVSASNRRPLSVVHSQPQPATHSTRNTSTFDNLLTLGALDIEDDDDGIFGISSNSNGGLAGLIEDEDDEVFQLDPVEYL